MHGPTTRRDPNAPATPQETLELRKETIADLDVPNGQAKNVVGAAHSPGPGCLVTPG